MDQDQNNILDFPIHRVKLRTKNKTSAVVSFSLESRKTLLSLSLFSVLVVVSMVNFELISDNSSTVMTGRSIASFGEPVKIERNLSWEQAWAQRLSPSNSVSDQAVRGVKPSPLDKLIFGELEGKYAVATDNGKLATIEYSQDGSLSANPKAIHNRSQFLMQNKQLLPYDFESIEKLTGQKSALYSEEIYALVDASGNKVAEVLFKLDTQGRFLSMTVSKAQRVAVIQ